METSCAELADVGGHEVGGRSRARLLAVGT